jgi:ATP-dependent exoDNAse (exonuclease V) beta subunit
MSSKAIGPNEEQLKAIEHYGGVLLSAGAGSGKTFVLVEHMVFLARNLLEKTRGLSDDEALYKLKKSFSEMVLMTFTTKATGELKIRLKNRFVKERETHLDENWSLVIEALEQLQVSTIHGHCLRLISQGFFPHIPSDLNLIDEASYGQKISRLFEIWLEDHSSSFFESWPWMKNIIYSNQKQLTDALVKVFSTPELRNYWGKASVDDICMQSLEDQLEHYFQLAGYGNYKQICSFDLGAYDEHKSKAWHKILVRFLETSHSVSPWTLEGLNSLEEFFLSIKRLSGPQARTGLVEVIEKFEEIKFLRSFIQDNAESLKAYLEHRSGAFRGQVETFKSIVSFIEEKYFLIPGSTFADLEYYVLKGLEDSESAKRVQNSFSYFIIDEFQDTSYIQFDILRRSIGDDFSKVFCVGDVKQAIYGFRGGELGVFHDCQERVHQNLELNNNYRSCSRVIEFNNNFFETLFEKGHKFEGHDPYTVPVVHQKSPVSSGEGELCHIKCHLIGEGNKPKAQDLNLFEARALLKRIKDIRENDSNAEVCVLYKNLKPSQMLISLLMKESVGFNAQVKVNYSEEPIFALAHHMLEELLMPQREREQLKGRELLLEAYFHYLSVESVSLSEQLSLFHRNVKVMAFLEAFEIFLQMMGVSNSNHKQNLKEIASMYEQSSGDLEKFFRLIKNRGGNDFSIQFFFGENSGQVSLMTAHASKGLEFEHVLLGGIHTNGSRIPDTDYFGKMPGSLRWKVSESQKKPYKSPAYLIEDLIEKNKNFAESKRLFYVAATRAVKSLSWVDLSWEKGDLHHNENSWINGLRKAFDDLSADKDKRKILEMLHVEKMEENLPAENESEEEVGVSSAPLFHRDTLGMIGTQKSTAIGLTGELSVTGLSIISLCPRRFYLSQVCKIGPDLLERAQFKVNDDANKEIRELPKGDDEIAYRPSSAERGTLVHEILSNAINHNFTVPLQAQKEVDERTLKSLHWALATLKEEVQTSKIVSEEALKFPVFGFMVSGTPDAVIYDEKGLCVVDFKTGSRREDKQSHYWTQLKAYAYGIGQLYSEYQTKKVRLQLVYVDEHIKDEQEVEYEEVQEQLYDLWMKTADLSQVNRDHCSDCPFGNLCLS